MRGSPKLPWWREKIDFGVYLQGIFIMLRNPLILLGPLPAALLAQVALLLLPSDIIGISFFIQRILDSFGLALAIVVADMVWRLGRTSFDQAWEETRRKAGEICYATLGYIMVVFTAGYIGTLGGPIFYLLLTFVALTLLIYSIAACTIGGVPGGMSLQASLNLTKLRPINTIILAIACLVPYYIQGIFASNLETLGNGPMAMIAAAAIKSVIIGYSGTIIAKRYADISFRNL